MLFPWRTIFLMSMQLASANLLPSAVMVDWPEEDDIVPDELLPLLAAKALTERGMPERLFQRVREYPLPDGMRWDSIPVCREFSVPVVMSDGVGSVAHFLITDSTGENKVVPNGLAPDALAAAMNALQCAGGTHVLWRRESSGLIIGPSLALSVALAALGHDNGEPHFMATGGLNSDGSVFAVEGVMLKADLAKRFGADLFLCPADGENIPNNSLPVTCISDAVFLLSSWRGNPGKWKSIFSLPEGPYLFWRLLHELNQGHEKQRQSKFEPSSTSNVSPPEKPNGTKFESEANTPEQIVPQTSGQTGPECPIEGNVSSCENKGGADEIESLPDGVMELEAIVSQSSANEYGDVMDSCSFETGVETNKNFVEQDVHTSFSDEQATKAGELSSKEMTGDYNSSVNVERETQTREIGNEEPCEHVDSSNRESGYQKTLNNLPLMLVSASYAGNPQVVEDILKQGADIDARDRKGLTALMLASSRGHGEVAELLLKYGADIEARDKTKATPLILAAREGRTDMVKLLLDYGADTEAIDARGMTAEKTADKRGSVELTELIRQYVGKRPIRGNFPLKLLRAAYAGNLRATEDYVTQGVDMEIRNPQGWTPLMLAVSNGHYDVVKFLAEHGANLEAKSLKGNTALMLASYKGYAKIVKFLLDCGADKDVYDRDGRTPLLCAVNFGNADVVKILLDYGVDKGIKDSRGMHAEEMAVRKGYREIVELIKQHTSNKMRSNKLPLRLLSAAYAGNLTAVQEILTQGAYIDSRNKHGWTALMLAASNGHVNVVKFLLDHGADPCTKNRDGNSAGEIAAGIGYGNISKIIEESSKE